MARGDITGIIDTLEYDPVRGFNGHVINISGNIYATAYQGNLTVGTVFTVSITPAGAIGAIIDTLDFDAVRGANPFIFPVSGDIYGIAYDGVDSDGFLVTVDIDTSGNIGAAVIDTLEFDTARGSGPSVLNVSGDIYIIAHGSEPGGSDTQWTTVDIDVTGTPLSVVDTETSVGAIGQLVDVVNVAGTVYAMAYRNVGATDNLIQTRTISPTGTIGAIIEDFIYDGVISSDPPRILRVLGDTYVVTNFGDGFDGFLYTINIPTNGSGMSLIQAFEFAPAGVGFPIDIAQVDGTLYAIVYDDDLTSRGQIQTVNIPASGTPVTTFDTFEFDSTQGISCQIRLISLIAGTAVVAVTYAGSGNDGFLITMSIDAPPTEFPGSAQQQQKLLLL